MVLPDSRRLQSPKTLPLLVPSGDLHLTKCVCRTARASLSLLLVHAFFKHSLSLYSKSNRSRVASANRLASHISQQQCSPAAPHLSRPSSNLSHQCFIFCRYEHRDMESRTGKILNLGAPEVRAPCKTFIMTSASAIMHHGQINQ